MRELGKDFGLVVVATRRFFRGKFFIPSPFFLYFFQLGCKGNRHWEPCISSLPHKRATNNLITLRQFKVLSSSHLRLAMFISLSIQAHEYSKRKISLPWERTLDTPYVDMKEKHRIKSKNWISVEPNNRKGDFKVPWAQVMAKRKETFLLGGNVRWLKRNNKERKQCADRTLQPVKRKSYME